jgi:hypothetical protein
MGKSISKCEADRQTDRSTSNPKIKRGSRQAVGGLPASQNLSCYYTNKQEGRINVKQADRREHQHNT